jgi:site-specific DNA recombinase
MVSKSNGGPITAVAYYRMSTDKQEDSIGRQTQQVESYAARHGYEITRVYHDRGIAGDEAEKRKGFMQMLRDAKERRDFGVILCDDKDRFGRFDIIDQGFYVKPLRDGGVRLETVAQGKVDWTTFAGRITDAAVQEAKKMESIATSRRVMTRMLMKAQAGQWTGGTAPYGYKLDGGKLTPGEVLKVKAVQLMFELYGRGYSLEDVRGELAARAVADPHGRPAWNKCTIRAILKNRKYVGDLPWNTRHCGKYSEFTSNMVKTNDQKDTRGRYNPESEWLVTLDSHPPLVSRELFERVQGLLAENRKRKTPLPRGGDFILSGILVCGHCGWRMHAACNHGLNVYYCSRYAREGKDACYQNRIREDWLVPAIVGKLEQEVLTPATVERLRAEMRGQLEAEATEAPADLRELRGRAAQLEQQVAKGNANMALAPADAIAGIAATVRAWRTEREAVQGEIDRLETDASKTDAEAVLAAAEGQLWRLREMILGDDPLLVREVLRELLSKVELWFVHRRTAQQTRGRFVRGLICGKGFEHTTEMFGTACHANHLSSFSIPFGAADLNGACA